MKKEENKLIDDILENSKYAFLKSYLEKNKKDILEALNLKVSYKSIFETIKKKTGLNIKYCNFVNILSDFKKKYIYNLSEAEYKKQMQAISQAGITTPEKKVEIKQPEILAAKNSEVEQRPQPAQPKEPEKVKTKKDVPADETPSGKIPKWKQEGFSSLNEYFDYLKKQSKSIPEEKKGFVYETSIVK